MIHGDPKYVFTQPFSGCTLVVDLMEKRVKGKYEKYYRVYHVQGGYEDVEYNKLNDHGYGMVTSMEYRNYGYFRTERGNPRLFTENIIGSAFMAYDVQQEKWILYHQSQHGEQGYLGVAGISYENGAKQIRAKVPNGIIVPKSAIVSVTSVVDNIYAVEFDDARKVKKVFVAEVHKEKKQSTSDSESSNCV